MQNKKVILGIIATVLIISIFVGISYAYWLNTSKQEDSNIAKTGCFNTTFTENSSTIKLEDSNPWVGRAGEGRDVSTAGIFYFFGGNGGIDYSVRSFRSVLSVVKQRVINSKK